MLDTKQEHIFTLAAAGWSIFLQLHSFPPIIAEVFGSLHVPEEIQKQMVQPPF